MAVATPVCRRITTLRVAGVALAALSASVTLAVLCAEVNASYLFYCGVDKTAGSWCGNTTNHSYDGQQITSNRTSNLSERMLFDSDPSMVRYPGPNQSFSPTMSFVYCYTSSGNTAFQFRAEAKHNYLIGKAQLNGFAYYGTASPTLC